MFDVTVAADSIFIHKRHSEWTAVVMQFAISKFWVHIAIPKTVYSGFGNILLIGISIKSR